MPSLTDAIMCVGVATANAFAQSGVPFLDMAANQLKLGAALVDQLKAPFEALGIRACGRC